MARLLRAIGVAVLITVTLHASAGLCFCHRGPDAPASLPGGHSCCHGADTSGQLAIRGVPTCCHIESAQRDMTRIDAVQLAAPTAVVVADAVDPAAGMVTARSFALTVGTSPPIQVLRL